MRFAAKNTKTGISAEAPALLVGFVAPTSIIDDFFEIGCAPAELVVLSWIILLCEFRIGIYSKLEYNCFDERE